MKDISQKLSMIFGTIIFMCILAGIIIPFFSPIRIIETGQIGITTTFGSLNKKVLDPGMHLINPFSKVTKMSARTEEYTMSSTYGEGVKSGDDSITAQVKEGTKVSIDITVYYRLNPEKATYVYKTYGTDYVEKVVRPNIRGKIRGEVAKFTLVEAYSNKKDDLENGIFKSIQETLKDSGVIIEQVLLRNVKPDDAVQKAIDEKTVANERAKAKEYEIEQTKKEAERKKIEAQGDVDVARIRGVNVIDWLKIQNNKGYCPVDAKTCVVGGQGNVAIGQ